MRVCNVQVHYITKCFREEKVKSIVDDIMEKLPDPFNMIEIMGKVEERTPYVVVAFQECERMNILTREMRRWVKLHRNKSTNYCNEVILLHPPRSTKKFSWMELEGN